MMAWRISARWQCHCPQHMGAFCKGPELSNVPTSLRSQVLQLLHLLVMQRMKQLAHIAVYWPRIDADIVDLCHRCTVCRAQDQTIHGFCRRNRGAECMLIMPSTSWGPTGWCLSTHIQSTLASTRLHPLPQSPARFCSFWHPHTIVLANVFSDHSSHWCTLPSCHEWSSRTSGADLHAGSL